MISEGLWRRRFAADPEILGRPLVLDGQAHTVIGVMPAGFQFPPGLGTDLWLPLHLTPRQQAARGSHSLSVLGRLHPGVHLEAAREEMRAIAAGLAERYPDEQVGRSARVEPLREVLVGQVRPALMGVDPAIVLRAE